MEGVGEAVEKSGEAEGYVLEGVSVQRRLSHQGKELPKGQVLFKIRPEHEGIGKKAD
jgi:hypothetical protein